MDWYGVRCVVLVASGIYEERVTLWRADSFEQAVARAEGEATRYALDVDAEYLGLAQAYELADTPGEAAEVFSLCRASTLEPREYLSAFFATGAERQEELADDDEP